jgi:hypothetical protein
MALTVGDTALHASRYNDIQDKHGWNAAGPEADGPARQRSPPLLPPRKLPCPLLRALAPGTAWDVHACMHVITHSLLRTCSHAHASRVCVCVVVRAEQMLKEEIRATRTQLDVNPNDSMALAKIGELRLELAMLKQVSLLQYYNMILS